MSLNKISGDDAWMDPPVPIPNTVVKHPEAESTCLVTGWEDRKLPVRSSGDGYVDPPVPIPNTVVKHIYAESTCLVTGWEDRKPLVRRSCSVGCMAFLFTWGVHAVPSICFPSPMVAWARIAFCCKIC